MISPDFPTFSQDFCKKFMEFKYSFVYVYYKLIRFPHNRSLDTNPK